MAHLKAAVPSDVDDVAGSVFTASRPRYIFSRTEAIDLREIPDLFFSRLPSPQSWNTSPRVRGPSVGPIEFQMRAAHWHSLCDLVSTFKGKTLHELCVNLVTRLGLREARLSTLGSIFLGRILASSAGSFGLRKFRQSARNLSPGTAVLLPRILGGREHLLRSQSTQRDSLATCANTSDVCTAARANLSSGSLWHLWWPISFLVFDCSCPYHPLEKSYVPR